MNPLKAEGFQETYDLCRKITPVFEGTGKLLDEYIRLAEDYEAEITEMEAATTQTPGISGLAKPVAEGGEIARYCKSVFGSLFNDQPEALEGIEQLNETVAQDSDLQKTIYSDQIPQWLESWDDRVPVQTDLMTLMVTLAAAHHMRSRLHVPDEKKYLVDEDKPSNGTCPTCGASPHFGMLREEEGVRIFECWLCGSQWTFSRLQCPSCGEKKQEQLGYFITSTFPDCRVHFCKRCHAYIKIFDLRKRMLEKPVLWVLHLASLHCDDAAFLEGFKPVSRLQWHDALAGERGGISEFQWLEEDEKKQ